MKYWDSSALVALHVEEPQTSELRELTLQDAQVVTWTMSDVEIRSAINRLARQGLIDLPDMTELISRVDAFWGQVQVVALLSPVKARAKRLLGLHDLRAADALQLAAALLAVHDDPIGHDFVCLDRRLAEAARREGFTVRP